MAVSEKKNITNKRYDNKTYKNFTLRLRKEDDADIIEVLEGLNEQDISKREWLRGLMEKNGYTRQQIIDTFADFRGVLTREMVERMLDNIK